VSMEAVVSYRGLKVLVTGADGFIGSHLVSYHHGRTLTHPLFSVGHKRIGRPWTRFIKASCDCHR
jgi:nucleoside-diphosphate-sugar epimerase